MSVACPPRAAHPRLVDQYAGIRQGKALLRRTPGEKHGGDGCSLAHAGGDHVRLDELHRVIDGEAGGDRAAWRIDVQLNVFFSGSSACRKSILRGGQIGNVVINRCADKDDVLFQEARIDVVSALAPGWSVQPPSVPEWSRNRSVLRSFSCERFGSWERGQDHLALAAATVLTLAFCANQSMVLSLRSFALILSSAPCFVKRARTLLWIRRSGPPCVRSHGRVPPP